jgi:hypothetical protein
MPGLVPGIHVFTVGMKDVDGRNVCVSRFCPAVTAVK